MIIHQYAPVDSEVALAWLAGKSTKMADSAGWKTSGFRKYIPGLVN